LAVLRLLPVNSRHLFSFYLKQPKRIEHAVLLVRGVRLEQILLIKTIFAAILLPLTLYHLDSSYGH
jgi:hypothetical protein